MSSWEYGGTHMQIQGGGLRLNDAAVTDGGQMVTLADLNAEGVIKLAAGKKKLVLIKPV